MLPALDTLTLRQLIGQMVVVRACGHLDDSQIQYPQWEANNAQLHNLLETWGVGGIILLGGSAVEICLRTQQLQSWAPIPLLIAADVEEGVGQRFAGATRFPPPMAFQHLSPSFSQDFGRITAQEASQIGINWLLAPIADVNHNPRNPVINIRAFGESIEVVSDRVAAFIQGAQEYPVLTTAKHFPGHGDTLTDSHLTTPVIDRNLTELRSIELPPFMSAIASGVDAVMTGHLLLPKIDREYVGTLSWLVITKLLRQELDFNGLVVTDALIMAGISDRYKLAEMIILAVKAGNDLLLMPPDPIGTIETLVQAVEQGQISYEQIRRSVERIWQAKQKVCTEQSSRLPSLDNRLHQKISLDIAQRSLRVISAQKATISIADSSGFTNLLVVDHLSKSIEFLHHQAPALTIPAAQGGANLVLATHQLAIVSITSPLPIFVQIFSRGNPFQAEIPIAPPINTLLKQWLANQRLLGVVLYGSPYYLPELQSFLPNTLPFVFSYGHHAQCQEVVMAQIFKRSGQSLTEY